MVAEGWLLPSRILVGLVADDADGLLRPVADLLARASGADPAQIAAAFRAHMDDNVCSIGSGVAIPHTELDSLTETVVCLVTTRQPLALDTVDGHAPDLFFFVLSRPDPQSHLLLLAHIARLLQSRTLREGLRRARTADEVVALIQAAELRHGARSAPALAPPAAAGALVLVSMAGEQAVDALLIELVGLGHGEASVLETQSLREATAREVPLFAGFRDLFGDPGGRRLLVLEATRDQLEPLTRAIAEVAEQHHARDTRISVVPLQTSIVVGGATAAPAPDRGP